MHCAEVPSAFLRIKMQLDFALAMFAFVCPRISNVTN